MEGDILTIFAANDLRIVSIFNQHKNPMLEAIFNLAIETVNNHAELKPVPLSEIDPDTLESVLAIGRQNEMIVGTLDDTGTVCIGEEDSALYSVFSVIPLKKLRAHFLKNVDPLLP